MIWASSQTRPRSQMFFLSQWEYEEYYDEDYEHFDERERLISHLPVAEGVAACGWIQDEDDRRYGADRYSILPPEDERCRECWRINAEHGGSVPPQDPSYGAEVGSRPGHTRGSSLVREGVNAFTVGLAEGGEVRFSSDQRAEWDSLSTTQQRQAGVSARNIRLSSRTSYGRSVSFFRISRLSDSDGGGILLVPDTPGT